MNKKFKECKYSCPYDCEGFCPDKEPMQEDGSKLDTEFRLIKRFIMDIEIKNV